MQLSLDTRKRVYQNLLRWEKVARWYAFFIFLFTLPPRLMRSFFAFLIDDLISHTAYLFYARFYFCGVTASPTGEASTSTHISLSIFCFAWCFILIFHRLTDFEPHRLSVVFGIQKRTEKNLCPLLFLFISESLNDRFCVRCDNKLMLLFPNQLNK